MYGYVYLTTNTINNRKYIGITHYDRPDHENYLGSGTIIKRAIKKYGRDSFIKEILEECSSYEDLIECEYKWTKAYNAMNSNEYYNLRDGGHAGQSESMLYYWSKYTNEQRKRMRNWCKVPSKGFKGHRHSNETKKKIGAKSVNRNWNRPTNYGGSANPNAKPVEVTYLDTNKIEKYECLKDYSNKMGYNYTTMKTIASRGTESKKYNIRIRYIV